MPSPTKLKSNPPDLVCLLSSVWEQRSLRPGVLGSHAGSLHPHAGPCSPTSTLPLSDPEKPRFPHPCP